MKKIVRAYETKEVEVKKMHLCKTLMEKDNQDNKVEYFDLGIHSGWYFCDMGVKIEGSGGANYGTAICFCPYCGERL